MSATVVGFGARGTRLTDRTEFRPVDADWIPLYRAAGIAALITTVLIVAAIAAHVLWPPPAWSPGAAADWFARFQESRLLGLLGLDLLIVFSSVLGVPIILALFLALRRIHASAMLIATAFALIGTLLHLGSNTAFEMLALSDRYSVAATDAERATFLAAGETVLAAYYGTAFHAGYVLGYVARLLTGAVMLRSGDFGRAAGAVGILAGAAGLGFYLPVLGMLASILSVLLIAVWHFLIARSLLRLGQPKRHVGGMGGPAHRGQGRMETRGHVPAPNVGANLRPSGIQVMEVRHEHDAGVGRRRAAGHVAAGAGACPARLADTLGSHRGGDPVPAAGR